MEPRAVLTLRARDALLGRDRSGSEQLPEEGVDALLEELVSPLSPREVMRMSRVHGASAVDDEDSITSGVSVSTESAPASPDLGAARALVAQESQLSFLDFLRSPPPCDCTHSLKCTVCAKPGCPRCLCLHRRLPEVSETHASLFCVTCPSCTTDPARYQLVCPLCKTSPLTTELRTRCTECDRWACTHCVRFYHLRSLGEAEPRRLCAVCVADVKQTMTAEKASRRRAISSPLALLMPRRNTALSASSPTVVAATAATSPDQPTAGLTRTKSATADKSPRRSGDRGPLRTSSGTFTRPLRKLTATAKEERDPFPGIKLHVQAAQLPNSVATRTATARGSVLSHRRVGSSAAGEAVEPAPVAVAAVSAAPPAAPVVAPAARPAAPQTAPTAALQVPQLTAGSRGLVLFDFVAVPGRLECDLRRGQLVVVHSAPAAADALHPSPSWLYGECGGCTGWFPRLNCSWDDALLAQWSASAWRAVAQGPRYKCGESVRCLRDGKYCECEVLHEGSATTDYRVRWLSDGTEALVDEGVIRPALRRTNSQPLIKSRSASIAEEAPPPHMVAVVSAAAAASAPTATASAAPAPAASVQAVDASQLAAQLATATQAATSPTRPRIWRPPPPPAQAPAPPAVVTDAQLPFGQPPTASVIRARPTRKATNPYRAGSAAGAASLLRSVVDACACGDLLRVQQLARQGASLSGADLATGDTPLIMACRSGHSAIVDWLVRQPGVKINGRARTGVTALHVLAESGNDEAALWLVRHGASLSDTDALGRTPLDLSASLAAQVAARPDLLLPVAPEDAAQADSPTPAVTPHSQAKRLAPQ